MAASVEARVPLLDERLLELAISIPPKLRTSLIKTKAYFTDHRRNGFQK